jgi:hypothetical protein
MNGMYEEYMAGLQVYTVASCHLRKYNWTIGLISPRSVVQIHPLSPKFFLICPYVPCLNINLVIYLWNNSMKIFRAEPIEDKKNRALIIYFEFGPDGRIPRNERLAAEFPAVSEEIRLSWVEEFEQIDRGIWKFAEEGGTKIYSKESFSSAFKQTYPWMNDKAIEKAYFLMSYYAWHEGYDK